MSDPSLALQGALIAALKALNTEAGSNVFDTVPTTNPFPRITVGEGDHVPADADCYRGADSTVQIDAWSRERGYPQVKRIGAAIWERLHDGELSVPGFTVELLRIEVMTFERDPDGLTSRARIQVRARTQPAD